MRELNGRKFESRSHNNSYVRFSRQGKQPLNGVLSMLNSYFDVGKATKFLRDQSEQTVNIADKAYPQVCILVKMNALKDIDSYLGAVNNKSNIRISQSNFNSSRIRVVGH